MSNVCSILLITVAIQYRSITHNNPTINFILISIYYTYIPYTKLIVSVVSKKVTKKKKKKKTIDDGESGKQDSFIDHNHIPFFCVCIRTFNHHST